MSAWETFIAGRFLSSGSTRSATSCLPTAPVPGHRAPRQRMAEILEAAKLADAAGLDVFAAGEHHRLDMAVSATPVVLAAIAAVTKRLRLGSAVTILSTADPVVVFEDFATVDLISGGRAELIVGRGIFTESFPLFGYELANSDELFAEKLELLQKLNAAERVTWQGRFRPPLTDAPIPPRPVQERLPIWIGSGGTQKSVERAGALGLPLAIANITLPPAKLAPMADLYRRTGTQAGHDVAVLKVSIATHMYVEQKLAERTRYILSALCRLLSHSLRIPISRPTDDAAGLVRRRASAHGGPNLRRKPAADHR